MTHKTRNRRNRSLNQILNEAFDAGFRALNAGSSATPSPIARELSDESDEPQPRVRPRPVTLP